MTGSDTPCPGCGKPLAASSAIEGYCARCVAESAFGDLLGGPEGGGVAEPGDAGVSSGLVELGPYVLEEELGRGGMGVVYRARHRQLGRRVALKVLRLGPLSTSDDQARFRREASAAAALRHPHVVTVYEVGEADGHAYLAMELVEGPSLAELTRSGPLLPERAARYAGAVADALGAAHAAGILHRDLKPANVLVDGADQPKVADFGLAKSMSAATEPDRAALDAVGEPWEPSAAAGLTRTGQILGSPGYMPPEQADPARGPLTFASDVYSLGALLFHLLTGRPPFAGPTLTATLHQVLNDEPAPPRRLNSAVPRDLETICLKCLQKEPARRYATAAEVASDLASFLARRPIRARPVSLRMRAWLWCRRRPALALAIVGLHVMGAAGLATVLWQARQNERNLYAADLRLAAQAIDDGDLGRARGLLALHRPKVGGTDFVWRHLGYRSLGNPRSLVGEHPWIVQSVAHSPGGRWLASGSVGSGTVGANIQIRDLRETRTGSATRILATNDARQLLWFPDDRHLLAVHSTGAITLFDVEQGTVLRSIPGASAGLSRDGRTLVTCEGDPVAWNETGPAGQVVLRSPVTGGEAGRAIGQARFATISPDAGWVAATDLRTAIELIEVATGAVRRRLEVVSTVWALAFSPDGRWLAAAGFGEGLQVWDLNAAGAAPRLFVGHTKGTWGIGFSPDSRRLASASADQTLRLWEVATGKSLAVLRGHGSEVWCVDFGAEGRTLVSGGKDRQVLTWPITEIRDVDSVEGATFSPLVFSGNSQRAATVSTNAYWSALVHEVATGRILRRFEEVRPLGLDDSGDSLWVRSQGFSVRELRVDTGRQVSQTELAHLETDVLPEHWTITPDGRWISGVAGDGWVSVWHRIPDAAAAPRVFRQRLADSLPWGFVHLTPGGGDLVVTVGEAGFWAGSLASGALRPIRAHLDIGKGAAFSPNGRLLATASVDATLRLWAYPELAEAGTLHGHPTEVSSVAFSPDGEILASSETGQGIRFWHVRTRREVAVLRLADIVQDLVFSPDGQILAASLRTGHFRLLRAPR